MTRRPLPRAPTDTIDAKRLATMVAEETAARLLDGVMVEVLGTLKDVRSRLEKVENQVAHGDQDIQKLSTEIAGVFHQMGELREQVNHAAEQTGARAATVGAEVAMAGATATAAETASSMSRGLAEGISNSRPFIDWEQLSSFKLWLKLGTIVGAIFGAIKIGVPIIAASAKAMNAIISHTIGLGGD